MYEGNPGQPEEQIRNVIKQMDNECRRRGSNG